MVRQAHHERKYENPFALSLSKGDLAKQGTFGAKLPEAVLAFVNRGMAYSLLGRDAEAESDFNRAVELGYDRAEIENELEELRQQHKS